MINWISETKNGDYTHRVGKPLEQFWYYWRLNRSQVESQGFQVVNRGGEYFIVQTVDSVRLPVARKASYIVPDQVKKILLPHQIDHTALLCDAVLRHRFAVDGSDTGTGKTYANLAVAKTLNLIPAIICPRAVIPGYLRACKYFKIQPFFVVNWEHPKSKDFPYLKKSYYPQYKTVDGITKVTKKITNVIWDLDPDKFLLIYDEVHRGKGEDTILSKILSSAHGYYAIGASATIASKPSEMRALGFLLELHNMINFHSFVQKNGGLISQHQDWEFIDTTQAMARIHAYIYPERGSRMRVKDIPGFPETQITAELIQIGNATKQNRAYQDLILECRRLKEEKNMAMAMVLNLRYRQMAELLKVDSIMELVDDHIQSGLSVVVFVNFIDTIYALRDKLSRYNPAIFSGENVKDRERERLRFHNDETRVILVTTTAGGAGLDLHDIHGHYPRIALISPNYSPFVLKQILGRIHRAGGKTKSYQRLLYAGGTVEEKVFSQVQSRLQALDAVNEGTLDTKDLTTDELFNLFGDTVLDTPEKVIDN